MERRGGVFLWRAEVGGYRRSPKPVHVTGGGDKSGPGPAGGLGVGLGVVFGWCLGVVRCAWGRRGGPRGHGSGGGAGAT